MSRFDSADQDRRLDGLIRVGVVEETTGDTVRVRIGEILTQPIPVKMGAAGRMRVWAPPSVGEQVVVAAPGGEPDAAMALPGLYSSAAPAPSDSLDETRIEWEDGASVSYDQAAGRMTIRVPGGVTIEAPEGVTIIGDVTVQGDVIADGVSLKEHVHGGVSRGLQKTDEPDA